MCGTGSGAACLGTAINKAVLEGGSAMHYETLLDYIHLNPVRARLIRPESGQSILDFPWSSVRGGYACRPAGG